MHPIEFIRRKIQLVLTEDGYSDNIVDKASSEGITYYRRASSFSPGKVFDECLDRAVEQANLMEMEGM